MNPRQRLLAVLKQRKVIDRIPWTALVTEYYLQSLPKSLKMSEQLFNSVDLLRYVGADVLEFGLLGSEPIGVTLGLKVETASVQIIEDKKGDLINTTLVTPIGSLSEEKKEEPFTTFITKYFIKNREDCEVMRYVYEHSVYEPDYGELKTHIDRVGDEGLVGVLGPRSPLQMILEELAGLETTIFLLNDHPKIIESLMRTIHEKNKEAYQMLAESPVDLAFSTEDTSTTMISPKIFEKYVMPFLNDYARILHETNKIHGVHMCGHINNLLGLIKQLDVDGIESVTPPPVGDTEITDAINILEDKFFIIGGLPAPLIKSKTVREVKKYVKDLVSKVSVRNGLIIEVTDDVCPGTPLDNLKAIAEAMKEYG